MIIAVLCENWREVSELFRFPKDFTSGEQVTSINKLHSLITTDINTYVLVYQPEQLLSMEINAWQLSPNCHYRKDLETFIKIATSRCRNIKEVK